MPSNKNANFRCRILDRCFQRRNKRWDIMELVEVVSRAMLEDFDVAGGIGKRIIQADIAAMRKEGAPIEAGRAGQPGYTYSDPNYGHYKSTLTEDDRRVIREAILLLRQFKELPHYPELEKTLRRIEGELRYLQPEYTESIQFERNDRAQGTRWIIPLYHAIEKRQALYIDYQPFTASEAQHYVMHPYLLKEYRNRWFLFGHAAEPDAIYNFALDRIRNVRPAPEHPYYRNPEFHPLDWFRDIIGVTRYRERPPVDLVVRTTPELGPYIDSKPLHSSQQRLEASDTAWRFSLRLIPNQELYAELRRFGPALEVESPPHFWDDASPSHQSLNP